MTRLKHPESGVNKFAHHRPDNELGRFTPSGQAFAETCTPSGLVQGDHSGYVKGFAQEDMADFRHPGLHLHAYARLVVARIKPRESRRRPGIAEAIKVGIEGQQNRDRVFAQARNTTQQSLTEITE